MAMQTTAKESAHEIALVRVRLDLDAGKKLDGLLVCETVVSEDTDGNELNHDELVDGQTYSSAKELIEEVSKKLGVDSVVVEIEE